MAKATKRTVTKTNTAPDPIHARIDVYRTLDREYLRLAALEDVGLDGVTVLDLQRVSDAGHGAGWEMANTTPTTFAGASEMLHETAFRMAPLL